MTGVATLSGDVGCWRIELPDKVIVHTQMREEFQPKETDCSCPVVGLDEDRSVLCLPDGQIIAVDRRSSAVDRLHTILSEVPYTFSTTHGALFIGQDGNSLFVTPTLSSAQFKLPGPVHCAAVIDNDLFVSTGLSVLDIRLQDIVVGQSHDLPSLLQHARVYPCRNVTGIDRTGDSIVARNKFGARFNLSTARSTYSEQGVREDVQRLNSQLQQMRQCFDERAKVDQYLQIVSALSTRNQGNGNFDGLSVSHEFRKCECRTDKLMFHVSNRLGLNIPAGTSFVLKYQIHNSKWEMKQLPVTESEIADQESFTFACPRSDLVDFVDDDGNLRLQVLMMLPSLQLSSAPSSDVLVFVIGELTVIFRDS